MGLVSAPPNAAAFGRIGIEGKLLDLHRVGVETLTLGVAEDLREVGIGSVRTHSRDTEPVAALRAALVHHDHDALEG